MTDRCVIHWFRRDLRLSDNPGLHAAAKTGLPVIPVYILSDWRGGSRWTGPKRQQFLCDCLKSLATDLGENGGRLVIRQGHAVDELRRLITECRAAELHFNASPDPFGKSVEAKVKQLCGEFGIPCVAHHDVSLHAPGEILTKSGDPYRVFTAYHRNWIEHPKPQPVEKPEPFKTPPRVKSLPLPDLKTWDLHGLTELLLESGGMAARARLQRAISGKIPEYQATRDLPAADGTSRISQDLRFGLVSVRTVLAETMKLHAASRAGKRSSVDTFIKELAWREFYFAILHHFPNVLHEEFSPDWRGLAWDEPDERFELWTQGRTGFPIVDAGMRELSATGFMHNRVRMITAMFLTKDLHIDWRAGESWFMQNLLDGEIASNNGGWQWSAGTGADAAPYFRIQNPWSQTARFDPKGIYIKKWLPQLAAVPSERFLRPPAEGKALAADYPMPCVDHKTERERTLNIFKHHRGKGSHTSC